MGYPKIKRGSIATPESEQADSNTPEASSGTAPSADPTGSGEAPQSGSLATTNGSADIGASQSTDANSPDVTPEAESVSAHRKPNTEWGKNQPLIGALLFVGRETERVWNISLPALARPARFSATPGGRG